MVKDGKINSDCKGRIENVRLNFSRRARNPHKMRFSDVLPHTINQFMLFNITAVFLFHHRVFFAMNCFFDLTAPSLIC